MSIQAITREIPLIPGEVSSVTNKSDSISVTQDVVESATSSNTQATSKKASCMRKCWDRMTSVFCYNKSRVGVGLTNNVSINNVDLIGSAVLNSDLVKIQGLVDLASGLKESNIDSQEIISQYVSQNSIGCMSVPEVEQFAAYIFNISQPDTSFSIKSIYLKMLLTHLYDSSGFMMRPEVYNVLPNFVKDELCCQVDALIIQCGYGTKADKTLVEIREQGLSDEEFSIEFINKFNQVTKEIIIKYNLICIRHMRRNEHVRSSCA